MKELKGGAPRHRFFSQSWAQVVERDELEAVDADVKTLEKENTDLKKKVLSLSNKLREVNNPGARKQYCRRPGRPTEATIKTFQK